MERERRAGKFQYRSRQASSDDETTIRTISPIQVSGKRTFGVKRLLVFREADMIVLSVMTEQGTAAFPLSRSVTAKLVSGLTRELAEPPEAENDKPVAPPRRRLGR